ncbi:MAG: SRPBCC family protein [Thermoleophilaceae bacterium]|nr:SRPBCC family protein [Thermoleophilaceae bacterium]
MEVWDFVMNTRNDPKWIANVVEVGKGADQPIELGLEIEETMKFYGVRLPMTLTVAEHEPPTRSAVDVRGPVDGRGSNQLEPVDGGTRFTMTMDTDAHGFFKLAEPVFARMARRDVTSSVETLKDILESGAKP